MKMVRLIPRTLAGLLVFTLGACERVKPSDAELARDMSLAAQTNPPIPSVPRSTSTLLKETQAQAFARSVSAQVGVTTLEQLMTLMPRELEPRVEEAGMERKLTWTFADQSQIACTFRPPREGTGRGLLLNRVEIR